MQENAVARPFRSLAWSRVQPRSRLEGRSRSRRSMARASRAVGAVQRRLLMTPPLLGPWAPGLPHNRDGVRKPGIDEGGRNHLGFGVATNAGRTGAIPPPSRKNRPAVSAQQARPCRWTCHVSYLRFASGHGAQERRRAASAARRPSGPARREAALLVLPSMSLASWSVQSPCSPGTFLFGPDS